MPQTADSISPHTGLPDSIYTARYPAPFEPVLDTLRIARLRDAGLYEAADTVAAAQPSPPAWQSGINGNRRQNLSGSDSGLLTILTLIFVALALNFRHCPKIFSNFSSELLSVRRRANVFDEHTTNETRVLILLIIQYVAYLGILLYALAGLGHTLETSHIFQTTASLMGLAGAYYCFQLCAYNVVGYVFGTPDNRRQWIRGFNASQALAGLTLMIPALITIFYPDAARPTLAVAAVFYIIARAAFIIKGFRIFFTGISSLVYFILYLCTLEIIPVIIIYRVTLYLVNRSPQ
ncbi:MAG: DUF4271 domain-containing protein, partial [Muribaculaceae bacterium]|nr:DUF4271 domain-containing protein [Muribaculaceae bacterium]MDE6331950.1 DUF4271 domain-containing protein [Muribaculaceae bacterium]